MSLPLLLNRAARGLPAYEPALSRPYFIDQRGISLARQLNQDAVAHSLEIIGMADLDHGARREIEEVPPDVAFPRPYRVALRLVGLGKCGSLCGTGLHHRRGAQSNDLSWVKVAA